MLALGLAEFFGFSTFQLGVNMLMLSLGLAEFFGFSTLR